MNTDILISNAKSLSPELSLAGLGLVIIILDLIVSRKSILQTVSLLGLAIPSILSVFLWKELGNPDVLIIPGSKQTIKDLEILNKSNLTTQIKDY